MHYIIWVQALLVHVTMHLCSLLNITQHLTSVYQMSVLCSICCMMGWSHTCGCVRQNANRSATTPCADNLSLHLHCTRACKFKALGYFHTDKNIEWHGESLVKQTVDGSRTEGGSECHQESSSVPKRQSL